MTSRQVLRVLAGALAVLCTTREARAQQTVLLSGDPNHREIWHGETSGSQTGLNLDRGDVGAGDSRRDLITGAPGYDSNRGRVYVNLSGPIRRGDNSFAAAEVNLTGGSVGDRFGEATAAGYITAREDAVPLPNRDLVVGAPGANGGAGAVYMFLRGLTSGSHLTPVNARLTIVGAPAGARLGATLATGDLNGDGYREIIAGAPGVGKVYVIKGGPSITGTVDLSSPSAAFFTINGSAPAGVGRSLAAGNITGHSDISYDLAIGAFNEGGGVGAVYVIRARTPSNPFPSTMTLTSDADHRFGGIDAGDFAGKSIEIGPFDNDTTSDLIIGAPYASGPGNSRPQGGEVYVIWGSPTLASRSLANADLTIYGAAAGIHEGWELSTGDVDRHFPYDLVSLAPEANGGIGELHMVLGRPRTSFPATLDFAAGTTMDRRIVGDPAAGKIETALVYDLTGEGVEDIVAGVPNGANGWVYVAFSPVFEAIMTYPAPGQNNATTNHAFEWTPVENADMYRLLIGSGTGRSDFYDSGETTATSIMVPPLPTGRTLFARIMTRIASVWRSKDSTFVLPTPATFIFPSPGMSGVRPGYFTWTGASGAEAYRLQVGTSPGANDLTDSGDITTTSAFVFSMPPSRTIYARINTKLTGVYAWTDIAFTTAAANAAGADSPGRGIGANFGGDPGGDVLLYKPGSGPWSLQISTPDGFAAVNSGLWASGWSIEPADFNGDGLTDLFYYRPSTGQWFKGINMGGGSFDYFGSTWATGWNVTVEDMNGDGKSDVFVYNPTTGRWFKCLSTGTGTGDFDYTWTGVWGTGWSVYPADFNGDGRGDIFVYNANASSDPNSGKWFRVISQPDNSFAYDGGTVRWANDWQVTPGDFNGDGQTDLFLYRPNGQWARVVWVNNQPVYESGTWGTGWTIRKGDFNGDGLSDLFVYNKTTGLWFVVITERSGALSYYGGQYWAPNWDVSVSDFNSDGRADLLVYNASNGMAFQCITISPGMFDFKQSNFGSGFTVIASRTILP